MDKRKKYMLYSQIVDRARELCLLTNDRISHFMDVESADAKFNIRLEEWLHADDYDFAHDFIGIRDHIVREEFPSVDFGFFVPRFAGRSDNNESNQ